MISNFRRILVLLAILAVGLGFLAFRYRVGLDLFRQELAKRTFVGPDLMRQATRISVFSEKGELNLTYRERAGRWEIELPGEARWELDPKLEEEFVGTLANLWGDIIPAKVLDSGFDPYGFRSPEGRVAVTAADGEKRILFGKKHPLTGRRFARLDGREEVFIVDGRAVEKLFRSPEDLRLKEPLRYRFSRVDRLRVVRAGKPDLVLTRSEQGGWTAAAGGRTYRADSQFVDEQIKRLLEAKVSGSIAQTALPSPTDERVRSDLRFELEGEPGSLGGQKQVQVMVLSLRGSSPEDAPQQFLSISGEGGSWRLVGWPFSAFGGEATQFLDRSPLSESEGQKGASCVELGKDDRALSFFLEDGELREARVGGCRTQGTREISKHDARNAFSAVVGLRALGYQGTLHNSIKEEPAIRVVWYRVETGGEVEEERHVYLYRSLRESEDSQAPDDAPWLGAVSFTPGEEEEAVFSGTDYARLLAILQGVK